MPYTVQKYGDYRERRNYAKTQTAIELKDCGANKLAVIKLIKEVTGLGLGEAKAIADNGGNVKENVAMDEAKDLKAKFEEAGATIELQ